MTALKRILLILCLLLPVTVSAMKIKVDEIDEFTGQRRLITSWEDFCQKECHIRFRLQNGHQYLDFKLWWGKPDLIIGEGDDLLFKSTDDNIVSFEPTGTFTSSIGGGAVGIVASGAWGIQATYTGDLSYFADNITRLIRINAFEGYIDKKVSEGDGKKIQKLYNLFVTALGGEPGKAAIYANYNVTFLKSTNGGKSWDVEKEDYLKDASPEEITELMQEWKSQSTKTILYDCKVKKAK